MLDGGQNLNPATSQMVWPHCNLYFILGKVLCLLPINSTNLHATGEIGSKVVTDHNDLLTQSRYTYIN